MAAAMLIVGPLQIAWLLLGYGDDAGLRVPRERAADRGRAGARPRRSCACSRRSGRPLAVATIVVVARRWRAASPSRRLAIAPVLVTGAVAFALLIPWVLNDALGRAARRVARRRALELALAAVPVAFLVGLLRDAARARRGRGARGRARGPARARRAARRARAGAARPVADRRVLAGRRRALRRRRRADGPAAGRA